MDIQNTKLEEFLKTILLRNLTISIKNKTIKRGKFILFRQNGYTIDFHLNHIIAAKQKMIICNLPIPFDIKPINAQNTIFDYKLNTFAANNVIINEKIKLFTPISKNKFYDTLVNIEAI